MTILVKKSLISLHTISVLPEWRQWTEWGQCTRTCGPKGTRFRSRDYIPGRHGAEHQRPEGSKQDSQNCSAIAGWPTCPRPSKQGQWGEWSQCTQTCYPEGSHVPMSERKRKCIEPIYSNDEDLNTNLATCETLPEIKEFRQCTIPPCKGKNLVNFENMHMLFFVATIMRCSTNECSHHDFILKF